MRKLKSSLGHLACTFDKPLNSSSVSVSYQVTKDPGFNTRTPVQDQLSFTFHYTTNLVKTDEKLIRKNHTECLNIELKTIYPVCFYLVTSLFTFCLVWLI